jgi:glycosyltransferase involved in cell wall biosynthesis
MMTATFTNGISKTKEKRISAIVPAYNEGPRIGPVLRVLRSHPLIGEVIVVSDGSTDDTAARARAEVATVLEMPGNMGKGEAMAAGVARARHDVIAFFDADIRGLTRAAIDRMAVPVLAGDCAMFTLIRDRQTEVFQEYVPEAFVIGGERALRREVWDLVPAADRQGFQVELALNHYALNAGMRIASVTVPGLTQVIKEKKRGLWMGLWLRLKMIWDCLAVLVKLRLLAPKPA